MSKKILVTGVGGNVGQGILRNISKDFPDIFLVGTNTVFLSAGNHLCDRIYQVPFSWEDNYIPKMIEICETHAIDLIIPSSDYEVFYLGKFQKICR